jgi:hypothetical protein
VHSLISSMYSFFPTKYSVSCNLFKTQNWPLAIKSRSPTLPYRLSIFWPPCPALASF